MSITFPPQSWVQAFHRLEARITRLFRQGLALRPPDFSEFRRKVDAYFAGLTGSPQMAAQPLHQTHTPSPQTPPLQLCLRERHRTRQEEPSPIILPFPNPTQDKAVKKDPVQSGAPSKEAAVTVAAVTADEKRTKRVVAASRSAERRPRAKLEKTVAERDLNVLRQNLRPNGAEQGVPAQSHLTEDSGLKKKPGKLQRNIAKVSSDDGVEHNKAIDGPAAGAGATPTPVATRRRHRPKRLVRKRKTPDQKVAYWQKKKPKHAKELARHIGSPKYTCLTVLGSAREYGPAHLHHTALRLIEHFRKTEKDWQREARKVLSAEVSASAGDQPLLDGLEGLLKHFDTYERSSSTFDKLQDLRTLGKLITELQQIALSKVKDEAVRAFKQNLPSLTGGGYLSAKGELAELASKAMQQGHKYQSDRARRLLEFRKGDYPGANVAKYLRIAARRTRSTMTANQAKAVCRLATAFLNQAYDFDLRGIDFRKRYDETSLAFLNQTGALFAERERDSLMRLTDVRDIYVDGLVTIPMKTAAGSKATGTASLVSMLVQGVFNTDLFFPGVSKAAREVFQDYVDKQSAKVWPFLETMGAKVEQ